MTKPLLVLFVGSARIGNNFFNESFLYITDSIDTAKGRALGVLQSKYPRASYDFGPITIIDQSFIEEIKNTL